MFPGSYIKQFFLFVKMETTPPERATITGTPDAIASKIAIPKVSCEEGSTKRSAAW